MQTGLDLLFATDGPWILAGREEEDRSKVIAPLFYSRSNLAVCVRRLRGHEMCDVPELMNEFSAALQFFSEFGENWYALEDCLENLDEVNPADAYILVVERAEELLADADITQLSALLLTLNKSGKHWSRLIGDNGPMFNRPAIPFHVFLALSSECSDHSKALQRIVTASMEVDIDLELVGVQIS